MKLHATITNRDSLTAQEAKVLELLCTGLLRKQIADALHRSYGCVSKQIESIAQKLDAHSAAEIVAKAVALNLVEIKMLMVWLVIVTLSGCCIANCLDKSMRHPPQTPPEAIERCHTRHTTPQVQPEI